MSGKFTSVWLVESVRRERENSSSDRPIALLCPLSEVVGKVMLRQMEDHMMSNGLYNARSSPTRLIIQQ